jgi:hypothetical protein
MDQKVSRAKLKLASTECDLTELKLAAEQFIELAGSKGAAHRLIKAANAKAKSGRHKGLQYRRIDAHLLWLVKLLRFQWMFCLARGSRLPTRHALIKKIVYLFWDHKARTSFSIRSFGPPGSSPDAAVKRLLSRRPLPLRDIADSKDFRDFGFVRTCQDPLSLGGENGLYYYPPPELWEEFHRARPELQLLPKVDAANRSEKLGRN